MDSWEADIDYMDIELPSRCTYNKDNLSNNPHCMPIRNEEQKIYQNVLHTIGNTPLIKLNRIPQSMGIKCEVVVKCEFLNPGGSIKDRMAFSMIENAEQTGLLKPGATIIETTSGNTGIAIAMASAVKGYNSIFVLPDKSSIEKGDIPQALGGKVVRVSTKLPFTGPGGVFSMPMTIKKDTPNSVLLNQFRNYANPLTHYVGTAMEIYEQCEGQVDMVALGVGTGGSMTGIGRKFKEILPNCAIVGIDPVGSKIAIPESLNETDVTDFEIEGIGHYFHPTTLDKGVVDFWVKVHDKDSVEIAKRLHKEEGILCGLSSGTILSGALEAAKTLKEGQRCVVILPDGVGNYLTKLASDYWMEARNFMPCTNTFNHWWWDYKISVLDLKPSVSVTTTTTCKEVLKLMSNESHKVLPVTTIDNYLYGIISADGLMKKLMNSTLHENDSISDAVVEKYRTVTLNSTLGILSRILDNEGFALIVEEEQLMNEQKHKLKGLIFAVDLLDYITHNNP